MLVALVVMGVYYGRDALSSAPQSKTSAEANDVYVRFDMEAYDKIQSEYWDKTPDAALTELFRLSLQKAANSSETLATSTRTAVAEMIANRFAEATSTDAKRALALNVVQVALYNLQPIGRDQLFSKQQQVALRQEVANVNPTSDLYGDLGLAKGASPAEINTAYQKKTVELAHATSSAALEEKKQVAYAHTVLGSPASKNMYDQAKIEPTVFGKVIGKTLYFNLTRISPTTLQEFALAVDNASTTPGLDSIIFDVRGNIGGSLDFLQAFLGIFIGNNQYAFDLYRKGEYQAQRTTQPQFGELSRFKDIAILTDNMTQSTAELTAGVFKRYHLAHVVGDTTRGWGTVENTYLMSTVIDPATSYALLLVNNITLRDDNVPIEGRGVTPDVSVKDKNWQKLLPQYFHSASLITALKKVATNPPIK